MRLTADVSTLVSQKQEAVDEDHAEFDPASLREHEEFTKVSADCTT